MLLILKAIILGIIEGITEFLPISSTGHLIISGSLLKFASDFGKTFEIVIQLGAILAVLFYYKTKIFNSIKNLSPGKWGFKLWVNVVIAFLPAAIIGLLLNDLIDYLLGSNLTVAIALIVGAVLMIIIQYFFKNYKYDSMEALTIKKSFFVGVFQCLALIPGMSRSASTILGGMINGLSLKSSAEFSFFLAIPTMFAATFYSLLKGISDMNFESWLALIAGFIVSFIVAFLVIDKFLEFLTRHSLNSFAYYRVIVGILLLILIYYGIIPINNLH